MSTATINDLLPIPAGTKQPHAYQVFGLEVGEQDAGKIKEAVQATISRLKEVQGSTDPKVWNKAAKLVQQAKQILADPEKKSQLDARFGIVQVGAVSSDAAGSAATSSYSSVGAPTASASHDPLAAVLPASDPLAAVLPSADPLAPVSPPARQTQAPPPPPMSAAVAPETPQKLSPLPPGIFGSAESPSEAEPAGRPVMVKKATKVRRRKSGFGAFVFGMFAIMMLAMIGGLGFLLVKYGQVALVQSNDGLTITTNPEETEEGGNNDPTAGGTPAPRRGKDNVMGTMAGNIPLPPRSGVSESRKDRPAQRPRRDRPSRSDVNQSPDTDMNQTPGTEMEQSPDMNQTPGTEMEQSPDGEMSEPEPPLIEPDNPESEIMMPVTTPTTSPESEMTEEMVAAADEEIKRVSRLIRSAKWKEMKPAAEKLTEELLTEEQSEQADALYELADLATFYRGGVERGVQSLTVGNDFEVTDSFRVIIVEKGDDLLVVRYNAKNRSYTFDEFPFSLAHKLATFSMDSASPTFLAAKAAYQALSPKATDAHRSEAIEWLQSINEPIEGADAKRVADTIKSMFSEGT